MTFDVMEFESTCPNCGEKLITQIEKDPLQMASEVRAKIYPDNFIYEYHITSEMIKKFLQMKARCYVPDVKLEMAPRYCEKKRKSSNGLHHSYAHLRIAFSNDVMDNKASDWYRKVGETSGNIRVVHSIFKEMIEKYQYNRKEINSWLESYKTMEKLEEGLGMTESYINDMRMYVTPRRVEDRNKVEWIFFNADPVLVIKDMLTDVETNELKGTVKVHDIYPISQDVVMFHVYLHPLDVAVNINPDVQQILKK